MITICPTVTTGDPHEYREQMERIAPFAKRVHIDLADGKFAPTRLINPAQVWWPEGMQADIHIMYRYPMDELETLISLKPNLIIVHAEAEGGFFDFARKLQKLDIKTGVALLQDTPIDIIKPALEMIDHVLVFSGDLGYFGGKADLSLLEKVKQLKDLKQSLEIGWDGGINDENAAALAEHCVNVLNVGGYIQKANDPEAAYRRLQNAVR